MDIRVIDDFLPAQALREHALASSFIDWSAPDGEVYRRVCPTDVPGLQDAIEAVMGPVDMLGAGYRLNFMGETPNTAIHSDLGWGTHALVLFLCDGPGGTAFWEHKATGARRIQPGDEALLDRIRDDWNRDDAWRLHHLVELRMGRALIYESELFHSRYPFAAFGRGPDDGRLIAVAFFTPRKST